MRAFITAVFLLIFFGFSAMPAVETASAQETCRCKGCGCKGGPGWRGPDGFCVSQSKLAAVCGTPPGAPGKQEGAPRVCFGKQAARFESGSQPSP
ncbi:MAG TPA: hypothetical protein VHK26_09595 [Methyloceanibacter sp.]|nr:hypothetical protein [Methyloceanibacter sp.]